MTYSISVECIACGSCMNECPVDAISAGDIFIVNADDCIDCAACAEVCPVDAISEI